jgi:hypothetical protein
MLQILDQRWIPQFKRGMKPVAPGVEYHRCARSRKRDKIAKKFLDFSTSKSIIEIVQPSLSTRLGGNRAGEKQFGDKCPGLLWRRHVVYNGLLISLFPPGRRDRLEVDSVLRGCSTSRPLEVRK